MRQPYELWNTQPRSTKCELGCTCWRHRRCAEGCTCGRHSRLADKPGYKGVNAEKHARHRRVHIRRGKASEYPCVHCGGSAREWAQIHGTDGEDPMEDYMPLCRKCHFRYDGLTLGGDTSMYKRVAS